VAKVVSTFSCFLPRFLKTFRKPAMNTTKKFTIKLQAFSLDELKLSSDVDISQYLNAKILQ